MQRLLLLGLNHTTAPLEVREKLAFAPEQRAKVLASLRERFAACEGVLLCTCNRVELYAARAVHAPPKHEQMRDLIAELARVPTNLLQQHVYEKSEREVIEHLFTVASSLDSMVVGETQILGQVRDAYDVARDCGSAGSGLNPLFQRAVAVGKLVMHETKIGEGRLSVGSIAVDCASRIFDHYRDKTVLCIGAGKMATLVLKSFAALMPGKMLICNRDPGRAEALAARFAGQAVPFDKLDDHLVAADVVVSSTGSQLPIITRSRFEQLLKQRRYRPAFLIDIALPRDIEAGVGDLENVYLYNIDDLQQVVSETRSKRSEAVEHAKRLVGEEVEKYLSWSRARDMGPLIDKLFARHHAMAMEEVERALGANATPQERERLEELARRIVNKMLHDPVTTLRQSEKHATGQNVGYLHALEKLFKLEDEQTDED
jgi:glutamyl-tRNA reductase